MIQTALYVPSRKENGLFLFLRWVSRLVFLEAHFYLKDSICSRNSCPSKWGRVFTWLGFIFRLLDVTQSLTFGQPRNKQPKKPLNSIWIWERAFLSKFYLNITRVYCNEIINPVVWSVGCWILDVQVESVIKFARVHVTRPPLAMLLLGWASDFEKETSGYWNRKVHV